MQTATTPRPIKRRYSTPETNSVHGIWLAMIAKHNAVYLRDGEDPSDYPDRAVAFETLNSGHILSAPVNGTRRVLEHF